MVSSKNNSNPYVYNSYYLKKPFPKKPHPYKPKRSIRNIEEKKEKPVIEEKIIEKKEKPVIEEKIIEENEKKYFVIEKDMLEFKDVKYNETQEDSKCVIC